MPFLCSATWSQCCHEMSVDQVLPEMPVFHCEFDFDFLCVYVLGWAELSGVQKPFTIPKLMTPPPIPQIH